MRNEVFLILSSILFGIGAAAALVRASVLSMIMNIVTAFSGVILAVVVLSANSAKAGEGQLFAMTLVVMLVGVMVVGCAVAYRRYMAAGVRELDEKIELRH